MKTFFLFIMAGMGLMLTACSSGGGTDTPEPTPPDPTPEAIPISLTCNIQATTRLTDTSFEDGDRLGLYVVNTHNGQAMPLQATGNQVDNQPFTYHNQIWTPQATVYWKDESTPADFYVYLPYGTAPADITAYAIATKADQRTEEAYQQSAFLWGKMNKVSPTESTVNLTLAHRLSRVVVEVTAGAGSTDADIEGAGVEVCLNHIACEANIDLADGTVAANNDSRSSLSFFRDVGNTFHAWVVPQTLPQTDDFLTVTIDGTTYSADTETFTLESGKQHTVTLILTRAGGGIQVSIGDWETDDVDYGGVVQ